MSALAKKWLIIAGIIVGVLSVVGITVGVLLNRPANVIARSDRLETPTIKSVERQEDKYFLTFDYISDAVGYRVTEYDEVNDERHTQTYTKDEVVYAGEYVKADITSFLFATHTEADFKQYKFTVLAKFSDAVFNSKESAVFSYENIITLKSPVLQEINPNSNMIRWDTVEYATSYNVLLKDSQTEQQKSFNTTETYATFDSIKANFGEHSSYTLTVVAKNADVTKIGYILESDESNEQIYIPSGQLDDFDLTYNAESKTIIWRPVVGADYYNVFISTYGVSPYLNSKDNKSEFSITANTISLNLRNVEYITYLGTIDIYVEAVTTNPNVLGSESNIISIVNKRQLAAPSNVELVSDANYLKVSWDASADAQYANGYNVVFFLYTQDQSSNNNYITNPQNYKNEIIQSSHTSSICEYTIPLAINPDKFFGVGVQTLGAAGSLFESSEFVYYKNSTTGKNLYNAKKILSSPTGIVASENEDGTISVSWNIVENARRYHVRVTDEENNNYYFPVVDRRTEFNRVNSRIPPEVINNNVTLAPGKYTIAVATESEGSYISEGGYNTSVSYPEGQNYVAYRTSYDLSELGLNFNLATKELRWREIEGASEYDVYVNGTKVQTVAGFQLNLTEYFNDMSHDSGEYQISVLVKGTALNFHLDTLSEPVAYNFIQKYATPTSVRINYADNNSNLATLVWVASANANENTTYTVVVNGEVVADSVLATQLDVTNLLILGANSITVKANEDETHYESATATITDGSNVYVYTLAAIEGDITVTAQAVDGGYPVITLQFAEVKNAQGYNIAINDNSAFTYSGTTLNGIVTIQLLQTDVAKLAPFKTNDIHITPSKGTNEFVVLPSENITTTKQFLNTYYIPAVDDFAFTAPTTLNTNLFADIADEDKNIVIAFKPLVLIGDNDEKTEITSYKAQILIGENVVNEFDINVTITYTNEEADICNVNLFDEFVKNSTTLYAGTFKLSLAGKTSSLLGATKRSINTFTIEKQLEQAQNISYLESEKGMILSWAEVEDATSYSVKYAGSEISGLEFILNNGIVSVNLTSEFYSRTVGSYDVQIVAKLGNVESVTPYTINVEKKIKIFNYKLVSNNTHLQIAAEDLPRTVVVPTKQGDSQIYATHLMLVFDSRDGAEVFATSEIVDGYTRKLVTITAGNDLDVDLSAYHNAQTCFVYAFNLTNPTQSSISDIVEIDLTGVIRYTTPTINYDGSQGYIDLSWNVEYLPFNDGMKLPNYKFDITRADESLLADLISNNNIEFVAFDGDGQEIANVLSYNSTSQQIEIDENNADYTNIKTIRIRISNQPAGNYVSKLQAKTTSISYADDSGIAEKSIVFTKTLPFPTKHVEIKDAASQQENYETIGDDSGNGVDLDTTIFNLYVGTYNTTSTSVDDVDYDKIDDFALTVLKLKVVEATYESGSYSYTEAELNSAKERTIKLSNKTQYGYLYEIKKSDYGITQAITSADPKYFVILIKYATFNGDLYTENSWTPALQLRVDNFTPEAVSNVVFNESVTQFGFSWDLVAGTNVDYKLYVNDIASLVTNTITYDANNLVTSIDINKSTIANYDPDEIYDVYFKIWVSGQAEPAGFMHYLINNYASSFVYDRTLDVLTINTNNQIAFDGVDFVSLNGYIYEITSNDTVTKNSITFTDANVRGILDNVRKSLNANRDVLVMTYAGSDVLFEGTISKFPVIIAPYANGIQVVGDELCWNAVEYSADYAVYKDVNSMSSLLKDSITTNKVALNELFNEGGVYEVYVQTSDDEPNNVFLGSEALSLTEITYKKPYDSVSNLNYAAEFNANTLQYTKTLSFEVGSDVPADNEKIFTIKIAGQNNLQFTATLDGNGGDVVFTKDGNIYTVNVSSQLNGIAVGDYAVYVNVGIIGASAVRSNSKNTMINIQNRKIVSIATEEFLNYFEIIPDLYVEPLDATELESYVATFNQKRFKLKTVFDYATHITISAAGQEVGIPNVLNSVSSPITIIGSLNDVVISLEINSNALGNMSYYDIPPANPGIQSLYASSFDFNKQGDQSIASSTYEGIAFYVAKTTPTYGEIVYTEPQEGTTGANELELEITNAEEGTYRVYFYEDSADFDLFDPSTVYADFELTNGDIENDSATINFVNFVRNAGLSFSKGYFSLAKLYDGSDTTGFYLNSFQGALKQYDYHYILGDIQNDEYVVDAQNGKYQLRFDLLDVQNEINAVKYHITLSDTESNEKTYACIVEYQNNEYVVSTQTENSSLFVIDGNKLLFDITDFAKDSTRNNYYYVGDYSYQIVATDEDAGRDDLDEFSINNIKRSNPKEGNYTFTTLFPITFDSVAMEGNNLVWIYKDNSNLGLDLTTLWQFSYENGEWTNLQNVTEENLDGGKKKATAAIVLSYSERYNDNGDNKSLKLRLNATQQNFIEDTDGVTVSSMDAPELPSLEVVVNTTTANDITFNMLFERINRATNKAWFVEDLETKLVPYVVLTIQKLNGTDVVAEATITISGDDWINYYKNGSAKIENFVAQLLTPAQKEQFAITSDDTTELQPGIYKFSAVLKNDANTQQKTYYKDSETTEIDVVVAERWNISNIALNRGQVVQIDGKDEDQYITYVGNLKTDDKRLGADKSKNWADGHRTTILSFNINNPVDGLSGSIKVSARIITIENGNVAKVTDFFDYATTVTASGEVWYVVCDLTSIWQHVGSPNEYFIQFYVKTSSEPNAQRRQSFSRVHSDDNAVLKGWFGENLNSHDHKFAIVNYKHLPTISLAETFGISNDGQYQIEWVVGQTSGTKDVFAFDLDVVEAVYNNDQSTPTNIVFDDVEATRKKVEVKSSPYKLEDIIEAQDGKFYRVTLTLSDNGANSYYIGEAGATKTSQKIYQYFEIFDAVKDLEITNAEKRERANDVYNFDGKIGAGIEPTENVSFVIIDEDSSADTTIKISFNHVPAAVAYRLAVRDIKDTNDISYFYIGTAQNTTLKDLYIYLNAQTNALYSDDDAQNVNNFVVGGKVGLIEVNGETTTVTIDGLKISELFADTNIGEYYIVNVKAFIPIPVLLQNNHGAGINQAVNNFNKTNERNLVYYIKFKTPTIESVVVSGDIATKTDPATNKTTTYILNKNLNNHEKYSYTLTFTISGLGSSTMKRDVAIMLDGHFNLSEAYIQKEVTPDSNGKATIEVTIRDSNDSNFKNLVNQSLPARLTFFAVVLPNADYSQIYASTDSDISAKQAIYTDSNETPSNKFIANKTINSLVKTKYSEEEISSGILNYITLGIQLPNMKLKLYTNNTVDGTGYNLQEMATTTDGKANNLYEIKEFGAAGGSNLENNYSIAVDPYVGFVSKGARQYLFENQFVDNNGIKDEFVFNVYASKTDTFGDPITTIKLKDVYSLTKPQTTNVDTNLYTALKGKFGTGGDINIKLVLVGSENDGYFPSEGEMFSMKFYVRDETTYNLTITKDENNNIVYDYTNAQDVTYKTSKENENEKTDFVRPSVGATFKKPNDENPNEQIELKNEKFLVGLKHKDASLTYYFVADSASVDVLSWICDEYYKDTNLCENAENLPKGWFATKCADGVKVSDNTYKTEGFIINTLTSGEWTISFTMVRNSGKVTSNYIQNKTTFTSQLKLKNVTTFNETSNNLNGNTLTLDSRLTLNNVNRTAKDIVIGYGNAWSDPINLNAELKNAYTNTTDGILNNESTISTAIANAAEAFLKNDGKPYGVYNNAFKLKYVYFDSMNVVESDSITFSYTYRSVVKNNFTVETVINGVGESSEADYITANSNIKEYNDGIVVYSDKLLQVATQLNTGEYKGFTVMLSSTSDGDAATSVSKGIAGTIIIGGVERNFIFIPFNPNHANCLGTGDSTDDPNTNYLQPGVAYKITISVNYDKDGENSDPYTTVNEFINFSASVEDEQTVLTTAEEREINLYAKPNFQGFKIDYTKYLGISYNSFVYKDMYTPTFEESALLDGWLDNYGVRHDATPLEYRELCQDCGGFGYRDHAEETCNHNYKWFFNRYICKDCDNIISEMQFYLYVLNKRLKSNPGLLGRYIYGNDIDLDSNYQSCIEGYTHEFKFVRTPIMGPWNNIITGYKESYVCEHCGAIIKGHTHEFELVKKQILDKYGRPVYEDRYVCKRCEKEISVQAYNNYHNDFYDAATQPTEEDIYDAIAPITDDDYYNLYTVDNAGTHSWFGTCQTCDGHGYIASDGFKTGNYITNKAMQTYHVDNADYKILAWQPTGKTKSEFGRITARQVQFLIEGNNYTAQFYNGWLRVVDVLQGVGIEAPKNTNNKLVVKYGDNELKVTRGDYTYKDKKGEDVPYRGYVFNINNLVGNLTTYQDVLVYIDYDPNCFFNTPKVDGDISTLTKYNGTETGGDRKAVIKIGELTSEPRGIELSNKDGEKPQKIDSAVIFSVGSKGGARDAGSLSAYINFTLQNKTCMNLQLCVIPENNLRANFKKGVNPLPIYYDVEDDSIKDFVLNNLDTKTGKLSHKEKGGLIEGLNPDTYDNTEGRMAVYINYVSTYNSASMVPIGKLKLHVENFN